MNLNPWFVTGFCEGEGAFTYSRSGWTIQPKFSVRQRSDYDDLVCSLARFFGVGTVYNCQARGKTKASSYYVVIRREELQTIVNHFRAYPLQSARKQAAFEAWVDLVSLRNVTPRNKFKSASADFFSLARKLSSLNTRPRGFTRRSMLAVA